MNKLYKIDSLIEQDVCLSFQQLFNRCCSDVTVTDMVPLTIVFLVGSILHKYTT